VPGVWKGYFRPDKPVDYIAGQYADVRLPDVIGDPRGPGRTFTFTSLPSDTELTFVYRYDQPASVYKDALQTLRPSTLVSVGDIMGDLVLPKLASVPLVFVAGGIGMASFEAMLRELSRTGEQREVHLFYSLRNTYDDAFVSLIDSFSFASKQRFIKPNYVNAADIAKVITDDSLVYLSGSERFVLGLRDSLRTLGYGDNQVIFDFYDGYAEL
jgi:ferredoxin-NADP reductase